MTNIATTLIAIALVDKVGRKPLLLVGSIGMAVTLGTMAIIFGFVAELQPNDEGELVPNLPGASGPIALIAANLFVVAFGMSWGPMVWVLLGEMFPNRIRAAALGLAAAGQWVANWLITVTFPGLRDHLGAAYGFYAICAFLSFLFVWKWVEETKGMHLEDMHREAHQRPRPRPARRSPRAALRGGATPTTIFPTSNVRVLRKNREIFAASARWTMPG